MTVNVSVEDPTGPIAVDVAGATGTIPAGSGRRGVTLTVPSAATGHVKVILTGTAVSFARPMLIRGASPIGFERLPQGMIVALCQRYFEKSYDLAAVPGIASLNGARFARAYVGTPSSFHDTFVSTFQVRKRQVPQMSWYSTQGPASKVRDTVASVDVTTSGALNASESTTGSPLVSVGLTVGTLYSFQWTAECDI